MLDVYKALQLCSSMFDGSVIDHARACSQSLKRTSDSMAAMSTTLLLAAAPLRSIMASLLEGYHHDTALENVSRNEEGRCLSVDRRDTRIDTRYSNWYGPCEYIAMALGVLC